MAILPFVVARAASTLEDDDERDSEDVLAALRAASTLEEERERVTLDP